MKKDLTILLLFLWLLPLNSYPQGTWEKIDVPTDEFLHSICFVDSLYGWVAGNSGVILHTTDGGKNWTAQESNTENNIMDIAFINRNYGWASSFKFDSTPYGTVLLKTSDGGDTWIQEPYPEENIFMNCILFLDSLNIWMGGTPHALVKSTDGGITWQQAAIDTSTLAFYPVLNIVFYNENYGYACGGMFDIAGVIWRTWDGGNLWHAIDVLQAPADEVHQLHPYDSITVIGAGGDPDFGYGVAMTRTSDGGLNWAYDELEYQGKAYDLDFRSDAEVWAPLGPRQKLIYSLDNTETWTQIDTPESTAIYDIFFADSLHGWAVGENGAMLKYIPPPWVSVPEVSVAQDRIILHQNYPNPFSHSTTIEYTIPRQTIVVLKIYDMLSREVAILVNSIQEAGRYIVEFRADQLHEGTYICRLVAGGDTMRTVMIRIK